MTDATSAPLSSSLIDRLAEELARRWRAGERPVVEDYLAHHPELREQPEAVLELLYEEFCLRQEHGQEGAAADLLRRFPQWQDQLRVLVDCHVLLGADSASPRFPVPEENLGEFHLLAELGRGAQGRVFLATQPALAARPVVLKLVPRSGEEHLSLARLQHTHIVPLYSVHDDPARGLRALCMPYFGGTTLARLLELLQIQPAEQRTGGHVLEALRQAQADAPLRLAVQGPACQFLGRVSYSRALCWMGSCLAEALQYTHERGLVHLDLKPSNVLWAADGQPMLLDLHLARAPVAAGAPAPSWLGGTPAYMAPEQRLALAAVREGRNVPVAVDGRADLYALGVLLCEALGGKRPLAAWLRRENPQVPPGLADILDRCLADDPAQRYPDATALADDLRHHLAGLPLRGVANRSLAERQRQGQSRRPSRSTLLGLVLAVLTGAGLALAYNSYEARQRRGALDEGPEPGRGERTEASQKLHLVVERVRALVGTEDHPPAELRAVEVQCRAFWDRREQIVRHLSARASSEYQQVQDDLLDLAILWLELRVRLAGTKEVQAVRREALEVLDQAEALFGPSCVLECERREHAAALGLAGVTRGVTPAPRTAWEYHALGRVRLRAGDLDEAAAHFDQAVALRPQSLWSNFYQGKCAYLRGRFADAVLALTACVALAPERAWCYYNRGRAYDALGRTKRALRDYDRALQLDPTLALAAVNRGMLHCAAGRYASALDDLRRALDNGADPALVHYDRALVHLARGERTAALASLDKALAHDPRHEQALALARSLRPRQ